MKFYDHLNQTEVLRLIGYNPEEFESITAEELNTFTLGQPITINESYPMGRCYKIMTGGVYYVEGGIKHPIPSKDVLMINFSKNHY